MSVFSNDRVVVSALRWMAAVLVCVAALDAAAEWYLTGLGRPAIGEWSVASVADLIRTLAFLVLVLLGVSSCVLLLLALVYAGVRGRIRLLIGPIHALMLAMALFWFEKFEWAHRIRVYRLDRTLARVTESVERYGAAAPELERYGVRGCRRKPGELDMECPGGGFMALDQLSYRPHLRRPSGPNRMLFHGWEYYWD